MLDKRYIIIANVNRTMTEGIGYTVDGVSKILLLTGTSYNAVFAMNMSQLLVGEKEKVDRVIV